jgi:hypothetical protein
MVRDGTVWVIALTIFFHANEAYVEIQFINTPKCVMVCTPALQSPNPSKQLIRLKQPARIAQIPSHAC